MHFIIIFFGLFSSSAALICCTPGPLCCLFLYLNKLVYLYSQYISRGKMKWCGDHLLARRANLTGDIDHL